MEMEPVVLADSTERYPDTDDGDKKFDFRPENIARLGRFGLFSFAYSAAT
jgi:hypothetical protein